MKVANWKTCKKFSINNQQFYFSRHLDHIWFIIAHNKIVKQGLRGIDGRAHF